MDSSLLHILIGLKKARRLEGAVQRLRLLPKVLSLFPSTHSKCLTTTCKFCKSRSKSSEAVFWASQTLYLYAHSPTIVKNKINSKHRSIRKQYRRREDA